MTLRELKYAQRPENLVALTGALGIAPLRGPLLGELIYYDATSSTGVTT